MKREVEQAAVEARGCVLLLQIAIAGDYLSAVERRKIRSSRLMKRVQPERFHWSRYISMRFFHRQ